METRSGGGPPSSISTWPLIKIGGGLLLGVLLGVLVVLLGVVVLGVVERPPVPVDVAPPVPPAGVPPLCATATVAANIAKPANRIALTICEPPTDLDYTPWTDNKDPSSKSGLHWPTLIEDRKRRGRRTR